MKKKEKLRMMHVVVLTLFMGFVSVGSSHGLHWNESENVLLSTTGPLDPKLEHPCDSIPCDETQECRDMGRTFACMCPVRYSGDACDIPCHPKEMNLVFVLDSSNSVDYAKWKKACKLVTMIAELTLADGDVHDLGVISFASTANMSMALHIEDNVGNVNSFKQAIEDVPRMGGRTNISAALQKASDDFFGRHFEYGMANIVMIITDGDPGDDMDKTVIEAKKMMDKGVIIFVVGIAEEMQIQDFINVVSSPASEHTFYIDSFDAVGLIARSLIRHSCNFDLSGLKGKSGAKGEVGLPGSAPRGENGATGNQGYPGRSGVHGALGEWGIKGKRGFIGIKGQMGVRGMLGSKGYPGIKGNRGIPGLKGDPGDEPIGPLGLPGMQGHVGASGIKGLRGISPTGIPGTSGLSGLKGIAGPIGRAGLEGETGMKGIPGDKGKPGSGGEQGSQGLPGPPGKILGRNDVEHCSSRTIPCHHKCVDTFFGNTCVCEEGYELKADNITCVDINECLTNNGGCEQECRNMDGSFTCSCRVGYTLSRNLRNCNDINECCAEESLPACAKHQICVNTLGSFGCLSNKIAYFPKPQPQIGIEGDANDKKEQSIWQSRETMIGLILGCGFATLLTIITLIMLCLVDDKSLNHLRDAHIIEQRYRKTRTPSVASNFIFPRISTEDMTDNDQTRMRTQLKGSNSRIYARARDSRSGSYQRFSRDESKKDRRDSRTNVTIQSPGGHITRIA